MFFICRFKVHSIILAAASEHFCNILFGEEKSYHLDFITSDTLEEIIQFCYTGQLQLTSKNIQCILLAADDLGMQRLKSKCNQFLESTIEGDNALHYALIAERCGLESFQQFAEMYLLHNCAKLCETRKLTQWNLNKIDDIARNLAKNQCELYGILMKSLETSSGENSSLTTNTYQAIYQTFVSSTLKSNPNRLRLGPHFFLGRVLEFLRSKRLVHLPMGAFNFVFFSIFQVIHFFSLVHWWIHSIVNK